MTVQQVHALICVLFGVRLEKTSSSDYVNYLGFESKVVDEQLLLFDANRKASYTFCTTQSNPVELFRYLYQRLGPVLRSYMWT